MKNSLLVFSRSLFIVTLIVTLGTCGIDDYIFLEQISRDTIVVDLNNRVTIPLPSQSESAFRNYEIYYRIYISGRIEAGTIEEGLLSSISPSLYSDYTSMQPYTVSTSTSTSTNIGTVFSNLKYFPLDFDNINYELRGNHTVVLDFAPTSGVLEPLVLDSGESYPLLRSSQVTNPAPNNRYFLNNSDLNSDANAIATRNADVQGNTTVTGERYAYVSMYIVATGRDNNYSPIFSKPTFAGVFLLPNGTR
ncbi:MAG: hypothetical protein LBT93_01975 [Treponema sp.]|jgi:hypothetical protein|nr:hypothetical protein [Treponema sp.]